MKVIEQLVKRQFSGCNVEKFLTWYWHRQKCSCCQFKN